MEAIVRIEGALRKQIYVRTKLGLCLTQTILIFAY